MHVSTQHDGLPPSTRWVAMLALSISISMSVLVGSIANVALPTIARDMGVTPADSIWVVNAYQLAVTISLMPLASLGDVYGHRRVYCLGLALYTIASLVCATALAASPRIQRLSGAVTPAGSNPATRAQPFNSAKREAFHSLVAKLR